MGFLSSIFAGATSILSKCGVKNTKSKLATALRTSVVLILVWVIVLINGSYNQIPNLTLNNWIFLLLSGFATGLSWLCYYYALSLGQVSVIVSIDRLSVVFTILFSIIFLKEKQSIKELNALFCLIIGSLFMALLT